MAATVSVEGLQQCNKPRLSNEMVDVLKNGILAVVVR